MATVVAVGSRSLERAQAFAARFDIARSLGSYEALADDPDVDAVYVATPHSRHAADTVAVPLRRQARALREAVRAEREPGERDDRGRRSAATLRHGSDVVTLPSRVPRAARPARSTRRIGEPLLVEASFGWRCEVVPTHRHFDLAQGGGALLDLGVYTVNLSQFVLGPVESVVARGHVGSTGVDEHVAAVLQHAGDRLGVVQAAIRTPLTCTARIACTAGVIDLPAFMHCPDHLVVRTPAGEERIDASWEGEGLRFQVEEVHRCLAGRTAGEPGDAVARDDGNRASARRHPRPGRCAVPGRMTDPSAGRAGDAAWGRRTTAHAGSARAARVDGRPRRRGRGRPQRASSRDAGGHRDRRGRLGLQPCSTTTLLARMPKLQLLAYAAGSVKHTVTPATWQHGVVVSSAAAANAVPGRRVHLRRDRDDRQGRVPHSRSAPRGARSRSGDGRRADRRARHAGSARRGDRRVGDRPSRDHTPPEPRGERRGLRPVPRRRRRAHDGR